MMQLAQRDELRASLRQTRMLRSSLPGGQQATANGQQLAQDVEMGSGTGPVPTWLSAFHALL